MTDNEKKAGGLPLSGLTVIEIGHSVAAPITGLILVELGARVIKVEKPEGDDARHWGPPFWHGAAAVFQAYNRSKRSLVVDLRDPADRAQLRDLIASDADAVVQNLRTDALKKYELDGETLLKAKPSLVYANIHAYGAKGPLADLPGYDPLMQAFGGVMSVTGDPKGSSVRVGTSIIDIASGMWAAIGILGALIERQRTGVGRVIDTSLFEVSLFWMAYHSAQFLASGEVPSRQGSGMKGVAPYGAFGATDGDLVIAAGNDNLFARLCKALERPDWVSDPRFKTNSDRAARAGELNDLINKVVGQKDRAHWQSMLKGAGVPCAPIQTMDQVLEHPQFQALGMLQGHPDPRCR